MAMYTDGFNELLIDMQTLMEIPDDVVNEMVEAGGTIILEEQKRTLTEMGLVDTGQLRDSLVLRKKIKGGDWTQLGKGPHPRYVLIHPDSTARKKHTRYRLSRRAYKRGKRTRPIQNNEVGFILEFGAPGRGIAATQWMRKANAQAEDAACAAAQAVYDNYLRSKNLL